MHIFIILSYFQFPESIETDDKNIVENLFNVISKIYKFN